MIGFYSRIDENLSKKYQIDIAIDLMGFTQRNRFNIFNIGCAPIQINYLGYAGTLGSNSIDYIIADNFVIPESKQKYFVEKIIYLPHTFMINDDSKKISKKEISKKECNIPENKIIFANFNKFYKITPKVFNSWIQILLKLPDSILWLYNDNNTGRKNLLSEAKKLGLNDNRIFFANKLPNYSDYIARLKNVDLDDKQQGKIDSLSKQISEAEENIINNISSLIEEIREEILSISGEYSFFEFR